MNRSHLDKLSESYAQIAEGKKSEEEVKDWNRKDDNPQGKKVDKKKVDKCTCESFYLKRLQAMNPVYAEQYRVIAEVLIGEGYESSRLLDNIIEALPMDVVGPEFVSAMKAVNPRIHENLETAEKRQARAIIFEQQQKATGFFPLDVFRGTINNWQRNWGSNKKTNTPPPRPQVPAADAEKFFGTNAYGAGGSKANAGSGRDGTFGTGTAGSGMPSNPPGRLPAPPTRTTTTTGGPTADQMRQKEAEQRQRTMQQAPEKFNTPAASTGSSGGSTGSAYTPTRVDSATGSSRPPSGPITSRQAGEYSTYKSPTSTWIDPKANATQRKTHIGRHLTLAQHRAAVAKNKQTVSASYQPEGEQIDEGIPLALGAGAVAAGLAGWKAIQGMNAANKIKKDAAAGRGNAGAIQRATDAKNKAMQMLNQETEFEGEDLQEKPGDGYLGPTVKIGGKAYGIPNPIRIAQDAHDTANRTNQAKVDDINKKLGRKATSMTPYKNYNSQNSTASQNLFGFQKQSFEPEGETISEGERAGLGGNRGLAQGGWRTAARGDETSQIQKKQDAQRDKENAAGARGPEFTKSAQMANLKRTMPTNMRNSYEPEGEMIDEDLLKNLRRFNPGARLAKEIGKAIAPPVADGTLKGKPGQKRTTSESSVFESLKQARKNVGASTCWDGYKAKGTKTKNGKEVPNCVKEGIRDEDAEKGTKERKERLEKKRGHKVDDHPQFKKDKKDDSYLETNMKKRQENNEKARKEMADKKDDTVPRWMKDDYDLYDVILTYLDENGIMESVEHAEEIMEQLTAEEILGIVEEFLDEAFPPVI